MSDEIVTPDADVKVDAPVAVKAETPAVAVKAAVKETVKVVKPAAHKLTATVRTAAIGAIAKAAQEFGAAHGVKIDLQVKDDVLTAEVATAEHLAQLTVFLKRHEAVLSLK